MVIALTALVGALPDLIGKLKQFEVEMGNLWEKTPSENNAIQQVDKPSTSPLLLQEKKELSGPPLPEYEQDISIPNGSCNSILVIQGNGNNIPSNTNQPDCNIIQANEEDSSKKEGIDIELYVEPANNLPQELNRSLSQERAIIEFDSAPAPIPDQDNTYAYGYDKSLERAKLAYHDYDLDRAARLYHDAIKELKANNANNITLFNLDLVSQGDIEYDKGNFESASHYYFKAFVLTDI